MKLAIKFNQKAVKVIKCENDIKVGHRMEADCSKIAVRGGKVISRCTRPRRNRSASTAVRPRKTSS